MNSINNGWDSAKQAETPYFHCGPTSQNQNERKSERREKTREWVRQCKHTNIYPYVYIHTLTDTQTYINTDTHMHNNTLFITQVR